MLERSSMESDVRIVTSNVTTYIEVGIHYKFTSIIVATYNV